MSKSEPLQHKKFNILRRKEPRSYILGAALSMMADSVEHVLTYWVLWQIFESPGLVGFQIVSHWLPFLLFSVYAGALAEKYDCRRIIQVAQVLFMGVSLGWALLFLSGSLEMWHACILLILHGVAGSIWMPAEQLMLYDYAGEEELPSAVRINATFRSLGFLLGPVIGSFLLTTIGSTNGMFVNIFLYLPLTIFLIKTKATGHRRDREPKTQESKERVAIWRAFSVLKTVSENKKILSMIILTALSAITIGSTMSNAMPVFAEKLGVPGFLDLSYGLLLFANGVGGVIGGFLLEASGKVPTTVKTAVFSSILLGATTIIFASSNSLPLAVLALFIGGFARITSDSTEMSIVQLESPEKERGRIIGAYSMFGSGMMIFSGITISVLGALVGITGSVLISGFVLLSGALIVLLWLFLTREIAPRSQKL